MRALVFLLILAPIAGGGLTADIKRAFRPDAPSERIERLALARSHVAAADEKTRNKGARARSKKR